MTVSSPLARTGLAVAAGLGAGGLFAFIVGDLDAPTYLIEQLSIGFIEVPFVVVAALIMRKFGWRYGLLFTFTGAVIASAFMPTLGSITPVVFLKTGLMGMILGEPFLFPGPFARRLTAVALPGFVLALVLGFPMISHGVSGEVVSEIRQDALDMYMTFMPEEDAINTADNAIAMFEGVFHAGMGVFAIAALSVAWLSFLVSGLVMKRIGETPEYVAPLQTFKLPFHMMWVFLGAFGLMLSEYQPLFPFALNLFVFMAFLYLVQGIAIVTFHMNRVSMGRLPRILFWLVFFVTIGIIGFVLVIAGVVDTWFNLRPTPSGGSADE